MEYQRTKESRAELGMELLRKAVKYTVISFLFTSLTGNAGAATALPETVDPMKFKTCQSHENFKAAFDYLKGRKDLPLNDNKILKAALSISEGCDGSAERFKKIFELLEKSGVDLKKSFELARDFAAMSDPQTDNFIILFKGLFLENKFDLDFQTAYRTALELSVFLPKDWLKVQKDFQSFLTFCDQQKNLPLPTQICARWTLQLLKFSDKFPSGIYSEFESFNSALVKLKGPQLPIQDRLNLTLKIFEYGEKAPPAFINSLKWSASKEAPPLSPEQAWRLALLVSQNAARTELKGSENAK